MAVIERRGCFVGVDMQRRKTKRDDVTVYLWALYRPHFEPKKGFGDLSYLIRWLNKQDLPGEAPADWVVSCSK